MTRLKRSQVAGTLSRILYLNSYAWPEEMLAEVCERHPDVDDVQEMTLEEFIEAYVRPRRERLSKISGREVPTEIRPEVPQGWMGRALEDEDVEARERLTLRRSASHRDAIDGIRATADAREDDQRGKASSADTEATSADDACEDGLSRTSDCGNAPACRHLDGLSISPTSSSRLRIDPLVDPEAPRGPVWRHGVPEEKRQSGAVRTAKDEPDEAPG